MPPAPQNFHQAQLGLRRIVLTNAWRVEKAYFSSHATEPKRTGPEMGRSPWDFPSGHGELGNPLDSVGVQ